MTYGLSLETMTDIHTILEQYDAIETAILYGSRAKGNFQAGSDIDLTLIGDTLDFKILQSLYQDFDDSSLPYQFDLSIFKMIDNQNLIDHIQRVGKVIYKK